MRGDGYGLDAVIAQPDVGECIGRCAGDQASHNGDEQQQGHIAERGRSHRHAALQANGHQQEDGEVGLNRRWDGQIAVQHARHDAEDEGQNDRG